MTFAGERVVDYTITFPERKLIIPLVIVIYNILVNVMLLQEGEEGYVGISLPVFYKVLHQYGQFQELV
jgi:hypothetical protein